MKKIEEILDRLGIGEPDGRPLYAYEITPDEQRELGKLLKTRILCGGLVNSTAQGFTLWASERIRSEFAMGQLTWEFVFEGLGQPCILQMAHDLTRVGLESWGRKVHRHEGGNRAFLYSLLAEAGLPVMALAKESGYQKALLGVIREIEAEGSLGGLVADKAARRAVSNLPEVLQTEEQVGLLEELALKIVVARSLVPEQLSPETIEHWLNANRPDWSRELPLRLSPETIKALIRPALTMERTRSEHSGPAVVRQLRHASPGPGWAGVAVIADGAQISSQMLPDLEPNSHLRLLTKNGASLRAVPDANGWELRSDGREPVTIVNEPDEAVLLSVYRDGRYMGEFALDPGFPSPDEAPSLWRPEDSGAGDSETLVPLSGRGVTRARKAYLLAPDAVVPEPGPGMELGPPDPAPGGKLWALTGKGEVRVGDRAVRLSTGDEADAPRIRMEAWGRALGVFRNNQDVPVFVGTPKIVGAEGTAYLASLGKRAVWRDARALLGGMIVEWVEGDVALARMRLVVLPKALVIRVRETGEGGLRLEATGVPVGWHLHFNGGGAEARARSLDDGPVTLDLNCPDTPFMVGLRLSDPETGAALEMSAGAPARAPAIFDDSKERLAANRRISVGRLAGWRGRLPERGGAMLLRLANDGPPVGFPANGVVGLAANRDLIKQALALVDIHGSVNLRLAAGTETPRLEIGRSDWDSERDSENPECYRNLCAEGAQLQAVCINDPDRTANVNSAEIRVDLTSWLGDDGDWIVQGSHPDHGVMRPFFWSASSLSIGSRAKRTEKFADEWRKLLDNPHDPLWSVQWKLIAEVSKAGDASALDQVRALAVVPAAAAALLLRAQRNDRLAALDLEIAAPLWWPLVACADWSRAMEVTKAQLVRSLQDAGFQDIDAGREADDAVVQVAMKIVVQRPDLATHLGQALADSGIGEEILGRNDANSLLPVQETTAREYVKMQAQEAARRFDGLPQGIGDLMPEKLDVPEEFAPEIRPLLAAPFVVGEAAAGLTPKPSAHETLQLMSLRVADPLWFDAVLPAAVTQALHCRLDESGDATGLA